MANYPAPRAGYPLAQVSAHIGHMWQLQLTECLAKLESYQTGWRLLYIDTPVALKVTFTLAFVRYTVAAVCFTVQVVGPMKSPGGVMKGLSPPRNGKHLDLSHSWYTCLTSLNSLQHLQAVTAAKLKFTWPTWPY